MLEIDGEYFIDQCEELKKEKNFIIAKIIIESATAIIKSNNEIEKYFIRKMARVQIGAVMIQPLFSHWEYGGEIVSVNSKK